MIKVVRAAPFIKETVCNSSKSYSNRLLILGSLKGHFKIHNISDSQDVVDMINCLEKVGLDIERDQSTVWIKNSFPSCEKVFSTLQLETGEGGTTNRFLIPFLALGKRAYRIIPHKRMKERPWGDIFEHLKENGVRVETNDRYWLEIQGPLKKIKRKITVDGSQSTQMASGLLMSFKEKAISLEIKNLKSSKGYYELTQKLCNETRNINQCSVPVDFSSLSYPLALAALSGEVLIKNCFKKDPDQPDSQFLNYLEKIGSKLKWSNRGLLVKKSKLRSTEINCRNHPDIFVTLVFLLSHIEGRSVIRGLESLIHKESNRLKEALKLLDLFGKKYLLKKDSLILEGDEKTRDFVEYSPPQDHRMVMGAYLFMRMNSGGKIYNAHYVHKSFPKFFEVME